MLFRSEEAVLQEPRNEEPGRCRTGDLPEREAEPSDACLRHGEERRRGPEGAKGARRLYNRSFIRLENISVGYTLPRAWTEKIQIDRVKVYGSVRNAAVWAKDWEGYGDPETGNFASRIWTLGLNLTF